MPNDMNKYVSYDDLLSLLIHPFLYFYEHHAFVKYVRRTIMGLYTPPKGGPL